MAANFIWILDESVTVMEFQVTEGNFGLDWTKTIYKAMSSQKMKYNIMNQI
jgi:hypothetical protein